MAFHLLPAKVFIFPIFCPDWPEHTAALKPFPISDVFFVLCVPSWSSGLCTPVSSYKTRTISHQIGCNDSWMDLIYKSVGKLHKVNKNLINMLVLCQSMLISGET